MNDFLKRKIIGGDLREIIKFFESPQNIKYVGRRMYVKCWFHNEKTPSMHVQEHGFYCFGCGAKGGIKEILKRVLSTEELESIIQEYKSSKAFTKKDETIFVGKSAKKGEDFTVYDWKMVILAHDLLTLNNHPNIQKVRSYLMEQRKINPSLISYPIGYYNKGVFFPQTIYSEVIAKSFNIKQSLPVALGGKVRLLDCHEGKAGRWISIQGTKESVPYEIAASQSSVLAITEGLTDAVALTQLCGMHNLNWHIIAAPSIVQMEKIIFNPYLLERKQIIIAFTDEDEAGIKEREKIRQIANSQGITKIILPSLRTFKDVGEILEKNSMQLPVIIKLAMQQSNINKRLNPFVFRQKNERNCIKICPIKT